MRVVKSPGRRAGVIIGNPSHQPALSPAHPRDSHLNVSRAAVHSGEYLAIYCTLTMVRAFVLNAQSGARDCLCRSRSQCLSGLQDLQSTSKIGLLQSTPCRGHRKALVLGAVWAGVRGLNHSMKYVYIIIYI